MKEKGTCIHQHITNKTQSDSKTRTNTWRIKYKKNKYLNITGTIQ